MTQSAGYSYVVVPAVPDVIATHVFYPATAREVATQLGPFELDVAPEAPIAEGLFPLVVISHGTQGSPLVHRTLAAHLAREGFVVACPWHPRDNRENSELAGTDVILETRPRHLQAVTDWMFANEPFTGALVPDQFAMVGHSLGGYTALAVAGGLPTSMPWESPSGFGHAVAVERDERLRAIVLLAPATPWFKADGALAAVNVPILLLTAEHDEHTNEWMADLVSNGVADPSRVERRMVPNAGHFSFETPFPDHLTGPGFDPSQDPPGFDRAAFQRDLEDEVAAFLERWL